MHATHKMVHWTTLFSFTGVNQLELSDIVLTFTKSLQERVYVCVCVCVTCSLFGTDLAEGVGLSIPVEVVSKPPTEWQQHNLDGQTQGGDLGWGCG